MWRLRVFILDRHSVTVFMQRCAREGTKKLKNKMLHLITLVYPPRHVVQDAVSPDQRIHVAIVPPPTNAATGIPRPMHVSNTSASLRINPSSVTEKPPSESFL